jgi:hypothetical protein
LHGERVLKVLVSSDFAAWFAALDDATAEDVATALDVIEQLGPERAAPGSRESLLWYEHPIAARFEREGPLAWELERWGAFRDYVRQILTRLEAERFAKRVTRLAPKEAAVVLDAVKRIKRLADPRTRWTLAARGLGVLGLDDANDEVRRMYFAALDAAGFEVTDVPAHSLALRELAKRLPAPGFRVLYGVDVARETALVAAGERLERQFYGDTVRRAERTWSAFMAGTGEAFALGDR